jgi:hypothetical protein
VLKLQLQEQLNTHATEILLAKKALQAVKTEVAATGHTHHHAWYARRSIALTDALTTRDANHNTNSERFNPPQLVPHAHKSTPMLASLEVLLKSTAQSNSTAPALI